MNKLKKTLVYIGRFLVILFLIFIIAFVIYKCILADQNNKPYHQQPSKAYIVINGETKEVDAKSVRYYRVDNYNMVIEVTTTYGDIYVGSPENITVVLTEK